MDNFINITDDNVVKKKEKIFYIGSYSIHLVRFCFEISTGIGLLCRKKNAQNFIHEHSYILQKKNIAPKNKIGWTHRHRILKTITDGQ